MSFAQPLLLLLLLQWKGLKSVAQLLLLMLQWKAQCPYTNHLGLLLAALLLQMVQS